MKSKMPSTGIIAFLFLYICLSAGLWQAKSGREGRLYPKIETKTPRGGYESFLEALASVESGGDTQAIGDCGKAVGLFQIWKIYVDDVNQIAGKQFSYADRLDPEKSRAMVKIYLKHYATQNRLGRPVTFEDMAAMHVAGPNGYRQLKSSKKIQRYVQKVKEIMR